MESLSCPHADCTFSFPTNDHAALQSLNAHWRKKHARTAEELYTLLFCAGSKPTCKCGCGGEVAFFGIHKGFGEWQRGHVSRVKNNWGHNGAAREKSLDTRRGMFERGELETWSKGLSKADSRIAAAAEKARQTFQADPDERRARSERMTSNRLSRVVPTLSGSAHPQWAGGVSALQALCRSHLFRPWVYPKLLAAEFRCSRCSASRDLCVHHDDVRFSTVLRAVVATLGEPGDDFAKKAAVAEAVTQFHLDRDVSGVVLCEECHAKKHAADA